MQLAIIELKKIMIKQKGIIFIFLFILIRICSLILFDKPINSDMEMEQYHYNHYLEKLKGELTVEKKDFFLEEQRRFIEANSGLQILNNKYYEGEVDRIEYEEQLKVLQETLEYEKGFHVIYDQFIYTMENPDNRFIMYTNGWEGLLASENIDWIFILLLLLLITPIFCEEILSEMDTIILTEVCGGRNSAKCKILLAIVITAILSIINSSIEYIFFMLKYGLEDGRNTLQSLSFFSSSSKEISIFGAFIGMHILKIYGSVFFTIILLFISVVMRKYALTLLISTTVLIIPYSIFSIQSTKYLLPSPLGFLLSTGYYMGVQYIVDPVTRENIIVFYEILNKQLFILILATTCIIFFMIYIIIDKNTNYLYKISKTKKRKVMYG